MATGLSHFEIETVCQKEEKPGLLLIFTFAFHVDKQRNVCLFCTFAA